MKHLTLIASAVAVASALIAGTAVANDDNAGASLELPKAVADLGIPGAKVDKTFDTGLDGINGWVISVENDTNVIYTTEDGKHAFVGMILGEGGENLTQAHMEQHMENSPLANMPQRAGAQGNGFTDDQGAAALAQVEEEAFYIEEGTGDKVLYVVFDTQCGYCQKMYQASRAVLDEVTIRWIPVGFMGEGSLHQAAQLVDADNPTEVLATFERGGNVSGSPSTEAMNIVSENSNLIQQLGIRSTPNTIYKDESGEAHIVRGALRAAEIRNL
jgi:thiol:disulfide interchange protein DsbG